MSGIKNAEYHGMTKSKEYAIWSAMKDRCYNPRNAYYERYGARGISVCNTWRNSFSTFFNDMGSKPDNKSLDRIDNNEGYSPSNCRWASSKEQVNNRRNNILATIEGETKTLKEWCEIYRLSYQGIWNRVHDRGWPAEEALLTPVRFKRGKT